LLVRYGGFSVTEAKQVPVQIRKWWLNRTEKALKEDRGIKDNEPQNMGPFGTPIK